MALVFISFFYKEAQTCIYLMMCYTRRLHRVLVHVFVLSKQTPDPVQLFSQYSRYLTITSLLARYEDLFLINEFNGVNWLSVRLLRKVRMESVRMSGHG